MLCKKCHNPIQGDAAFCPMCGARQIKDNPQMQTPIKSVHTIPIISTIVVVVIIGLFCLVKVQSDMVGVTETHTNEQKRVTSSSSSSGGFSEDWVLKSTKLSFQRTDYFNDTTHEDLLRYPNKYHKEKVFFERWTVEQVIEPQLYLMSKQIGGTGFSVFFDSSPATYQYIIIDDKQSNGVNAIVGDVITVYGKYYANGTVTTANGQAEQTPYIRSDLLILNSIEPTMEDFSSTFIEFLNVWPEAFGNKNEYVSGQTVKLLCKRDADGYIAPYNYSAFDSSTMHSVFYVDGYYMASFVTRLDGKAISSYAYNGSDKLSVDITDGDLYWITGTLSLEKIYYNDILKLDFGHYNVILDIKDAEPYLQ